MDIVVFSSTKGGQGTTSLAAAVAVQLAADGAIVSLDGANVDDLRAVVGDRSGIAAVGATAENTDWLVYDAGVEEAGGPFHVGDVRIMVIQPSYLAVRRALSVVNAGHRGEWDGVAVIQPAGSALDASDVHQVLDLPVVSVEAHDAAIGGAVDAGLLGTKQAGVAAGRFGQATLAGVKATLASFG